MRRRHQGFRVFLVLGSVVAFAGCAAMQQTVGGWFGTATPTPTPAAEEPAGAAVTPTVYYADVDGLKVYSKPSASAKVVGALSLHEKVTRTKLERGYAYVESATSGVKGWVNNAQLIWRLPTASVAAPEPEAPVAETPPEPQAPTPTATAMEIPATPAPAAPQPQTTPRSVAPSIFNPY